MKDLLVAYCTVMLTYHLPGFLGTSIELAVCLCVSAREWLMSSSWLLFALCYTVRNIADSQTFTLVQRCQSFQDQMQSS